MRQDNFTSRFALIVSFWLLLLAVIPARAGGESNNDFQSRLQAVLARRQKEAVQKVEERRSREKTFLDERNKQQFRVEQLRKRHALLHGERLRLEEKTRELNRFLEEQKDKYDEILKSVGNFPQVINAFASKLAEIREGTFYETFPTATTRLLKEIASARASTLADAMNQLWPSILQDLEYAGQVSRKKTTTVLTNGTLKEQEVLFYGPFLTITSASGVVVSRPDPVVDGALRLSENSLTPPGSSLVMVDRTLGRTKQDSSREKGILAYLESGGVIGLIILLLGVSGLTVGCIRYIALQKIKKDLKQQIQALPQLISDNPLSRIVQTVADNGGLDAEGVTHAVESVLAREIPILERGQRMLKLMAASAPLLGLLGTVSGMIITFQSISAQGTDPALMASGIAQALVTTMLGLIVAIPVLSLHALLAATSDSLTSVLEEHALGIIAHHEQLSKKETEWESSLPKVSNL
jgi:biopolymer transport protein ExbB